MRSQMLLRNLFAVAGLFWVVVAGAQQMPPVIRDQSGVPAVIRNGGARVLDVAKAPGGMTAYTVEKDGKPLVFFISPDKRVAFVGVMFDAQTGQNLSDSFVENSQRLMGAAPAPAGAAASSGDASIPDYLASAVVAGVSEGRAAPAQTTFVFYDPRCPYCHALYRNTRDLARLGATIKWIPVNVLGDAGLPMAVQVNRRGIAGLDDLSNGRMSKGGSVTMKERADIEANTSLMRSLVKQYGLQAATPTIVYQDKNRKLSMYQDDGSNKPALMASFGR